MNYCIVCECVCVCVCVCVSLTFRKHEFHEIWCGHDIMPLEAMQTQYFLISENL
jgi:hypothetical protein